MYLLKIVLDQTPESPRDWGNLSLLLFKSRYISGDDNAESRIIEAIKEKRSIQDIPNHPTELLELALKCGVVASYKEVYAYVHSGATISTSPFSCRWDSGMIGYSIVLKKDAYQNFGVKRITKNIIQKINQCIEGEIETYDHYIRGDVYGYKLIGVNGEEVDSCYGFYGDDIRTNGISDHVNLDEIYEIDDAF
jgi:hypothetical protein